MNRLQEQILKVLNFSGGYETSAFIASELKESAKNVGSRLSEMKAMGIVGLDKEEGGWFANTEWVGISKKEKKDLKIEGKEKTLKVVKQDPFIELDKLNLISLDNAEEKLIVLGRLKSMFTRCNLNEKLHNVIDEIMEDYKLWD